MHPLHVVTAAAFVFCCAAQEAKQEPQQPAKPAPGIDVATNKPHFVVRHYPKDKDAAIAIVGTRTLTLGDLVAHIDARHYPGFTKRLERPEIQRYLQSDLIASWVRHFADIEALRQSLGDEKVDEEKLGAAQSAALKQGFERFLEGYVANLRAHGRPTELTQDRVNKLLTDYQIKSGLACELQGFLDYLEPGDYPPGVMRDYFEANIRTFGGQVTIAHILVQNRDAGTGILLDEEGQALANARLADVRARVQTDGSNFEEVARLYSDDTRTAPDGGRLEGVRRHDDRLPAALCRAAWSLRDGEVSGVVETQYGWHIVKRIDFLQTVYALWHPDAMPDIKIVMRRAGQEDRLFGAREKATLRLLM